jgi:general secretion pathway protein J
MIRPGVKSMHVERGFTLIELLVVMTLLSIIMVGLVTALRNLAQTENKIDQRLNRLDEIRVVRHFIEQTLTWVSAAPVDSPDATGKKILPFTATPNSVSWVGILPARPNLGGRHFFRLAMEDTPGGPALMLRFAPWQPDLIFTDWVNAEARILLHGVQSFTVQAKGYAPEGRISDVAWPTGWQNGWPLADALPEQLRFQLIDDRGEWPQWILAPMALPGSDGNQGPLVFGATK